MPRLFCFPWVKGFCLWKRKPGMRLTRERFHRMSAILALAACLTAAGGAPVPAEDVLLPAPSECRSDASVPVRLPLRLAVYAPGRDAGTVEALLNVLNAQGIVTGLSMTGDRESADVLCSLEGESAETGEGYEMRLENRKGGRGVLHLRAAAPQGLFYAWQSAVQILNANRTEGGFSVPAFSIRDVPQFEWRGIMLDVSRHFFTMAEVKRMIDTMSLFKLNRLHLHLTDGPGWRLEIKKYPLLTAMSAWRVPLASGEWNWQEVKLAIQENDPEATYGGFYTQEQMKEIIAYARSRRVTVVPEIELPGHAYAAMHAYGELVCDGVNFPVEGKKGRDTVCMGRPETLRFVKDVVDELKTIFPPGSPIHLGHDEVSTESWRNCKYCQSRLKELNENSLKALGRDFLQQVASYVRQGGYDAIVWDEGGELEADKHIFVMALRERPGRATPSSSRLPPISILTTTSPPPPRNRRPLAASYPSGRFTATNCRNWPRRKPGKSADSRPISGRNTFTTWDWWNTWHGPVPWLWRNGPGATATPGITNPSAAAQPWP